MWSIYRRWLDNDKKKSLLNERHLHVTCVMVKTNVVDKLDISSTFQITITVDLQIKQYYDPTKSNILSNVQSNISAYYTNYLILTTSIILFWQIYSYRLHKQTVKTPNYVDAQVHIITEFVLYTIRLHINMYL